MKLTILLVSATNSGNLENIRELYSTTVSEFIEYFGKLPSRFDTIRLPSGATGNKVYCLVRNDYDLVDRCVTLKVIDPDETSSSGYPTIR